MYGESLGHVDEFVYIPKADTDSDRRVNAGNTINVRLNAVVTNTKLSKAARLAVRFLILSLMYGRETRIERRLDEIGLDTGWDPYSVSISQYWMV